MPSPRLIQNPPSVAGPPRAAWAFAVLFFTLSCSCSSGFLPPTPAPPDHRSRFRSCGWITTILRPRELAHVRGATVTGDDEALSGVTLLLESPDDSGPSFIAISDSQGRFDFGSVPEGRYTLYSCLPGFDSVEMPVRVSRSARAPRLNLYMALSA